MINAGKMTREEALKQEEAMLASYKNGVVNNVNVEEFCMHQMGFSKREVARVLSKHSRIA